MRKIRALSLFLIMSMLLTMAIPASASSVNDFAWIAEHLMTVLNNGIQYTVAEVHDVKSSFNENIYKLIVLSPYGYAIYNDNTGGFEEIAPYSEEMPYDLETMHDIYYLGPNKYYYASGDYLIHSNSGDSILRSELDTFQAVQRAKESQESAMLCEQSEVSTYAVSTPVTLVDSVDYYITEFTYFTSLLGNDFGNNILGTCTMVATAILLGFYDEYVNDAFVSDIYRSGYGTTEDFHQMMRMFICPDGTSAGILDAAKGVRKYLAGRGMSIGLVHTVIGDHIAVFEVVEEQIRQGRPVVTAMFRSYNGNCSMDHTNVTYGYTIIVDAITREPMEIYYHVHNGWRGSSQNLMTYNYAWFADAMYLGE